MRISIISPPLNMGGGTRVISIYASMLASRGHKVTLISQRHPRVGFYKTLKKWIKGEALDYSKKSHFDGLSIDQYITDVYRPVAADDVPDSDVVIATWWETAEWVATYPASKGAKMYFVQGYEVFDWFPPEMKARSESTYRLPMRKIAISRWLIDVLKEKHGPMEVDLVPNAVDHEQFNAKPRGKQWQHTVGFLYSRTPLKGAGLVISAIEEIRRRFPAIRVIAFGIPPLASEHKKFIEYHRDPPQDAIKDLYAMCDIWVTASYSEGFNLTAMEAMACRTPVIATRTGWPPESIVDGVNGWLVDIGDKAGLVAKLSAALELSDSQWRAVSDAAFATVENCTWEAAADQFENAIATEVGRNRRRLSTGTGLRNLT